MKTIFDLRENQEERIYEAIQDLYNEPLKIIKLEARSITACTGCWSCWVATPGKCVMKDQMTEHYSDYVNSDTVILLLSTAQGFINHQAKAFLDRSIPHYHPYIEMINGECHHVARYKEYPNMVFYYETEGLINQEEEVIEDYLYRTAYHYKSKAYRIIDEGSLQLKLLESRQAKNQSVLFGATEPMEKLVIYNGSPRRSRSNSTLILKKVSETLGSRVEIRDLKDQSQWQRWAEAFDGEKHVMFFMPLYVHAMPSHVMGFIEKLKTSKGSISFFVQSGFPESSQSHYLEAYFQQLAIRLGRTYMGTVIKGHMESLQMMPPNAQENMIKPMIKAIEELIYKGSFNLTSIRKLAKPVRYGKIMGILFKLQVRLVNSFYWDGKLKENKAYDKRFDRPHVALNKECPRSKTT